MLLGMLALPRLGSAAPVCDEHTLSGALRQHQPPLDRPVSLKGNALLVRTAIERLANAAHVRVSYSAESIPLEREVCVSYKDVPVGDALADLLKGLAVEAVVAGSDHVVLAPARARAAAQQRDPQPLYPLSPVIATASVSQIELEPPTYATAVLDRSLIASHGSIEQALNASVPGVWAWQSPAGFTALYSVRGASSFGASSPKVYIDGIEVANPLLATQILPENIERIEIIRGPQGGALYGGDAIGGVTNIVTRHDAIEDGEPRLHVRSGLALSGSQYMPGAGLGQDHIVSLQLGTASRSGAINFGLGNVGEYMPGASQRHVSLDGSTRLVGSRSVVTGTARFVTQSAGNPFGLVADSALDATRLSMRQYTLGARALVRQSERVTHSIVLGIDGYTLSDLPRDSTGTVLSLADSVLRAAGSEALRTTARVASVIRLADGAAATTTVTLAAEHSNLHQEGELSQSAYYQPWTESARPTPAGYESANRQPEHQQLAAHEYDDYYEQSRSSNGLSAQVDASFFERAFVTGALRLQQDQVDGGARGSTLLPMLAASYVAGSDAFNLTLRGSYGKAIRWPEMPNRIGGWPAPSHGNQMVLAPEQQTGFEAGIDIAIGRALRVQVTRYDQTATGLLQCVAVPITGTGNEGGTRLELQNVGEIANRGWEVQGSMRRGALALTGGLALTDSRVLRVATGYTGDLRAGDRMLGVPARTASISASWMGDGWMTSLTAYRAFDWTNYDRIALAQADDSSGLLGVQLRDYWREYQGSTHLRASLSRSLSRSVTLLLTGDNLFGNQTGEPDNMTVLPGRTLSAGVKAAF